MSGQRTSNPQQTLQLLMAKKEKLQEELRSVEKQVCLFRVLDWRSIWVPSSVVTVIASARCAATVASLQSGVPCHHFLKQCARKRLPIVMWKVCLCARWSEGNHRGLYWHQYSTLMERTLVFLQGVRVPNPRSVSLDMSSIMINGVTDCSGNLLWWNLGLLSPLGKNLEINLPP
jgi:hypothetical protein